MRGDALGDVDAGIAFEAAGHEAEPLDAGRRPCGCARARACARAGAARGQGHGEAAGEERGGGDGERLAHAMTVHHRRQAGVGR
jgi:hypothetical protein